MFKYQIYLLSNLFDYLNGNIRASILNAINAVEFL
jgi:hypothetical protein